MNTLINLIIKIFQAVFDEDRQEREKRQARMDYLRAQSLAARSGNPEAADAFYEALLKQTGPPQAPVKKVQSRTPKPKPVARKPEPTESYQEHLDKFEAYSHQQENRAYAMQEHVDQYLGKGEEENITHHEFKVPGRNPLEQAIVAAIIFGPCKAHKNSGKIRTL